MPFYLRAFFQSLWTHWVTTMSGVISLVLGLLQHFMQGKNPSLFVRYLISLGTPTIWFGAAVGCLFLGAYQAWRYEHHGTERSAGPEIIASYYSKVISPTNAPIMVKNLRGGTAYNLEIPPVNQGMATAAFLCVDVLQEGASCGAEVQVTVSGVPSLGTLPVMAMHQYEADRKGMPLFVVYSDIYERKFVTEYLLYYDEEEHAAALKRIGRFLYKERFSKQSWLAACAVKFRR